MVIHKVVAGELRPLHRVLALANPLFRRTPLVIKPNDPLVIELRAEPAALLRQHFIMPPNNQNCCNA